MSHQFNYYFIERNNYIEIDTITKKNMIIKSNIVYDCIYNIYACIIGSPIIWRIYNGLENSNGEEIVIYDLILDILSLNNNINTINTKIEKYNVIEGILVPAVKFLIGFIDQSSRFCVQISDVVSLLIEYKRRDYDKICPICLEEKK